MKNFLDKHKEFILYSIFGCGTFVIDVGTFFLLSALFDLGSNSALLHICSIVSTLLAVTFAYITNRKYVFKSPVHNAAGVLKEMLDFYAARIFTMIIAEVFLEITVIHMGYEEWLMKLTVNIIVILLNYIFSKFWIFRV